MAKNNEGVISYTSTADFRLVRGVVYDVQKESARSLSESLGFVYDTKRKIFIRSEDDASECALDVTHVSVDFSVGHQIEAIIDKKEDVYFLRNFTLDKEFLANADTALLEPRENERPKLSNFLWIFPPIIGGIFLLSVFSSRTLTVTGILLILSGVLAPFIWFSMFKMKEKVYYVNHMIELVIKLTGKGLRKETITWPRPDGKAW